MIMVNAPKRLFWYMFKRRSSLIIKLFVIIVELLFILDLGYNSPFFNGVWEQWFQDQEPDENFFYNEC